MARLHRLASAAVLVTAIVAGGVVADPVPAGAAGSSASRQRQEQVRAQRAKKAKELNALRASDRQLERAVADLETKVRADSARLASARQAVAAADAQVRSADARIAQTEREMQGLQSQVLDRAVAAYIHPQRTSIAELADARDLGEASRKAALLQQVANNDRDVIDQLRAKREDLGVERDRAAAARSVAQKRREAVRAHLNELADSMSAKKRVQRALDARIREITAEAEALAREDANITRIINTRSGTGRASRSGGLVGDDGGRVSGSGLAWPVRGTVTSEYGYRWGRMHAGIDIAAPRGTPIRAAKAGDVIFSGWMSGYGNCVIIDHGGGFSTLYAHQSRIAAGDGAAVGRGEVIGYVGSTGHSTGNHLHFETRVSGSPQNPRRHL
jgi:murein DD-endopeptidase MepM/ murein hydrolase activator NlpD